VRNKSISNQTSLIVIENFIMKLTKKKYVFSILFILIVKNTTIKMFKFLIEARPGVEIKSVNLTRK
jgi:hypothetical protein